MIGTNSPFAVELTQRDAWLEDPTRIFLESINTFFIW